jgi:predicted glycoside hydrolase/deacetylase ChbG (UPF0249 family)
MLIVNADDWGRSKTATDEALVCYRRGRISSATGMVFMRDSRRAAELANEVNLDVGLHLNLSEEFSAPSVPGSIRQAHDRVRRFLTRGKYALVVYHPGLRREFALLFRAQLDEFVELYGRLPSHIDGHQHLHLCSNLLLDDVIPRGARVRRSFSFRLGERSILQTSYRRMVDLVLARRYQLTDYFFALAHHLSAERLGAVISLAAKQSVEFMTHPQLAPERAFVLGDDYGDLIKTVQLGSYSSL